MDYTVSILQTAEQKREGVMKVISNEINHAFLSFVNVRNGNVATSEVPAGSLSGFVNSDIWIGVLVERGDDEYAGRRKA